MSRHRDVRNAAHERDDDYGTSYEEVPPSPGTTPTSAMYMVDRSRLGNTSLVSVLDKSLREDEEDAEYDDTDKDEHGGTMFSMELSHTPPPFKPTSPPAPSTPNKYPATPGEAKVLRLTSMGPAADRIMKEDIESDRSSVRSDEDRASSATPIPNILKPMPQRSSVMEKEVQDEIAKLTTKKSHISVVVIGHVDAGKSTLMGHLLYDMGKVSKQRMHKLRTETVRTGKQTFAYAWVLDEGGEERERGITMDIAVSEFVTEHHVVTLLDAPGHKDFIPQMITGTASADVSVLVVSGASDEAEVGLGQGGQTKEHAMLARSLGVRNVVVAVTKLDTVKWSSERYDDICVKVRRMLIKQAGFAPNQVVCVPVSGYTGINIAHSPAEYASGAAKVEEATDTSADLASWYTGPTLVQALDSIPAPERPFNQPFRLVVSDIARVGGTSGGSGTPAAIAGMLSGKVESGALAVGDNVLVLPDNVQLTIRSVFCRSEAKRVALAGEFVEFSFGSAARPQNIGPGYVLCDPLKPVPLVTRLVGSLIVFESKIPITPGFVCSMHVQNLDEPVIIERLSSQIDRATGEVVKTHPRVLPKNSAGKVVLQITSGNKLPMDTYANLRAMGRFMLRHGGETVAAGVVTKILA